MTIFNVDDCNIPGVVNNVVVLNALYIGNIKYLITTVIIYWVKYSGKFDLRP